MGAASVCSRRRPPGSESVAKTSGSAFSNESDCVGKYRISLTTRPDLRFGRLRFFGFAASFAGREKQVRLSTVLLGVELVIAAAQGVKRLVRAPFDDMPV